MGCKGIQWVGKTFTLINLTIIIINITVFFIGLIIILTDLTSLIAGEGPQFSAITGQYP